jgi:hypothetical protein
VMLADREQHSPSFGRTRRRAGAAGLAALLAAGLVAAAPAVAHAAGGDATVFTHSARSGQLKDGRLTLRGVSGRVAYATNAGRSGVVPVRTLHRLILPGKAATGTLHVAGHRGGDEPAFRLSRPRYDRAHRTVSYRAKPLDNRGLPRRAARAAGAPRRFKAASLSIVPHARLMGAAGGGASCQVGVGNNSNANFTVNSSPPQGDQAWIGGDPNGRYITTAADPDGQSSTDWETAGNSPGEGCSNSVTLTSDDGRTITIAISRDWGSYSVNTSCTPSDSSFSCSGGDDGYAQASWTISGG